MSIIYHFLDSSKILGCRYVGQFMTFCDVGGKVEIRYSRLSDGKQRKRSHCPTMSRISKWGMELYMTMHDISEPLLVTQSIHDPRFAINIVDKRLFSVIYLAVQTDTSCILEYISR